MNIDDYFAAIQRGLRQNVKIGKIDEPVVCLASDDHNGILRCRFVFWDESYLDLYETVSTELGYPVRIHYAYIYVRQGQCVFRYDNAPHHPEIATYPHHKHNGPTDELTPADQPSLGQVLAEAESRKPARLTCPLREAAARSRCLSGSSGAVCGWVRVRSSCRALPASAYGITSMRRASSPTNVPSCAAWSGLAASANGAGSGR